MKLFRNPKKEWEAFERHVEEVLHQESLKQDWSCSGCRIDTKAEYFMVTAAVWQKAARGGQGLLCVGCVEKRIGRRLTRADFSGAPVNEPGYVHLGYPKTQRLIDRLTRH